MNFVNCCSPRGSLWINIDDNEAHYLKILCDELFGRGLFIANVLWQKRTSPDARVHLGGAHDHILVYCKDKAQLELNKLPLTQKQASKYKNQDNDPRGPWTSGDFTAQGWRPNQMYTITTPAGVNYDPPDGRCWANIEPAYKQLCDENRLWFGSDGTARPRVKKYLHESEGVMSWTWWTNSEVGHNQEAKKESNALFGASKSFATPKPERLIQRIIEIATNPGELVFDSFAGSGTTGAVAQKMGRRWIMVELGEHCQTHILPRLKKVIDGDDPGGVTEQTNWKGGGGFRYFTLAPSLLEKDKFGNWIVNQKYNAELLAQAICKLEGFQYEPSDSIYWQHGHSTENDFIYVTTQNLTRQQIEALSEEVGRKRSLLVFCSAYRIRNVDDFPNLTLRKIPKAVLSKCEWGKDDYSLEIKNLAPPPDPETEEPPPSPRRRKRRKADTAQQTLFSEEGGEQ